MTVSNVSASPPSPSSPGVLGFDPGRDKCGIAVMGGDRTLYYHDVVPATEVIAVLQGLLTQYSIGQIVLGDQTTAKTWKSTLEQQLSAPPPITLVDERYTTLEARDRYWQMFPPRGLGRWVPLGLRSPPRPIDDIVAILLIERYLRYNESIFDPPWD